MVTVNRMPLSNAWDDLRFPLVGYRLDTSGGHIDYNYTDVTVDFDASSRYSEDYVTFLAQMPHGKEFGTAIHPHIHWVQEENHVPNFLLGYRWSKVGDDPTGSWTIKACTTSTITYSSGSIHQLTEFPPITPAETSVSGILQMKLYRDTANVSTLFSGADAYTGLAKVLELDLHLKFGADGSREEYVKF